MPVLKGVYVLRCNIRAYTRKPTRLTETRNVFIRVDPSRTVNGRRCVGVEQRRMVSCPRVPPRLIRLTSVRIGFPSSIYILTRVPRLTLLARPPVVSTLHSGLALPFCGFEPDAFCKLSRRWSRQLISADAARFARTAGFGRQLQARPAPCGPIIVSHRAFVDTRQSWQVAVRRQDMRPRSTTAPLHGQTCCARYRSGGTRARLRIKEADHLG